MGLLNSLFGNNELNDKIQELETINSEMEAKIINLENEKSALESLLTPEMKDLESLKKQIAESQVEFAHQKVTQEQHLKEQYDKYMSEISKQKSMILAYNDEINELNSNIKDLKKDIITFSDEILVQDFGLYEPRYSFINAAAYKAELTNIRNKQKAMIKDGSAVSGSIDWQVNGSTVQGRKMIKDMQKLLLRAFNSECDEIISKVKYNNYDASVPFKFDVHAMIFSEDAPALEAKLHRAFEDRKLNLVNQRREFFKVSLDEIKEVVKNNFDKTVEFVEVPDADQYRISLKLREEQSEQ